MAEFNDDEKSMQALTEATDEIQPGSPSSQGDVPVHSVKAAAVPGPIMKSYQVHCKSLFSSRNFEISSQGQCVYWSHCTRRLFKKDTTDLLDGGENGAVIASAMLGCVSRDIPFHAGSADVLDAELWPVASSKTWTKKAWTFSVAGRHYTWRRTHNKALGASKWSCQDFKLLDLSDGDKVVAVFVHALGLRRGSRVDFYQELGRETEAACLVIILTIEDRIRQQNSQC